MNELSLKSLGQAQDEGTEEHAQEHTEHRWHRSPSARIEGHHPSAGPFLDRNRSQ